MAGRRKYRDHAQFGANAPKNWRENTTGELYNMGMQRIAPLGMRPRADRVERFEQRTREPESATWHHNWDMAMFGGTDIPHPTIERKQLTLEEGLDGIQRIPLTEKTKKDGIWYLGEWWEKEYSTAEAVVYRSADGKKRLYVYWDQTKEVRPVAPPHVKGR